MCVLCVVCSGGCARVYVFTRVCVWGRVYVGVHALQVCRGVCDDVCVWVCMPCVCVGGV